MWQVSSPAVRVRSYLDRMLVRKADTDFVTCPTFYYVAQTDHRLVRVSLWLANRPSLLTGDIGLPRPAGIPSSVGISGGGDGNKWWGSLKHRIRDFTLKYGHQLNIDKTKMAKSWEDKLSRALEGGDSLAVNLARWDNGYVVRYKFKRVPNEAVKCNTLVPEDEIDIPIEKPSYIFKSPDGRMLGSNSKMYEAFRVHFCDRFARCPDLPVKKFRRNLADFPHLREAEAVRCKGLVTECIEAGRPQQRLLHMSVPYVQPLVRPRSHPWKR